MSAIGLQSESRLPLRRTGYRRFLPIALVVVDIVSIYAAFILAYWIRYSLKLGPQIKEQLTFSEYQPLAILMLVVMLVVMLVKGAYRPRLGREMVSEVVTIFSSATISVATIVVFATMAQKYLYSRGVIIYVWILVFVLVSLGRALFRSGQTALYRKGWGVRRLLVVGATDAGKMIMQSVMSRQDLGYDLIGFIDHRPGAHTRDFGRFRALGSISQILEVTDREAIDDIILALPASAHEEVWPILSLCEDQGVGLRLVPDLFEMSLSRVEVDELAGIPLLNVQEKALRRVALATKRTMDVVGATVGLLLSLPILAVLGVMIRLETPGPALVRQKRVGLEGREFTCYKLRTMHQNADMLKGNLRGLNEVDGPLFKIRNDPRCTPLGRRIRQWSIDELPQFWNVIQGDMSLVGPRPPLPQEVAQYGQTHRRRLEVQPGMTGVWQVSGRSDLGFEEMLLMDIYYVENWSPGLDCKILLRTVAAVLRRHGAY